MARILIVDDDELMAEIIIERLATAGHMASAIHHGDDALQAIAAASAPDLLILDYNLPGQSGLSILREVRRQPRAQGMPVIMLTAKVSKLLFTRAQNDGADDCLTKPVDLEALLERAEALLVGTKLVRQMEAAAPLRRGFEPSGLGERPMIRAQPGQKPEA